VCAASETMLELLKRWHALCFADETYEPVHVRLKTKLAALLEADENSLQTQLEAYGETISNFVIVFV
jgi:hypothetical protein